MGNPARPLAVLGMLAYLFILAEMFFDLGFTDIYERFGFTIITSVWASLFIAIVGFVNRVYLSVKADSDD